MIIKCKICEKMWKNNISLCKHVIQSHKIKSKDYYDQYLKKENDEICLNCGKETKYRDISNGYHRFCCVKCSTNFDETKEKIKQTNLEKYGVECSLQNKDVKNKIKQTNMKKYGCEYGLQNKNVIEKRKQTNLKKYGYIYPLQNKDVKEKTKQTNLKRYGYNDISKNKEIREKAEQTNLKKYGYKHPLQNNKLNEKQKQTYLKKQLLQINKLLKYLDIELLDKYQHNREMLNFKCLKCDNIYKTNYFNIQRGFGKCPTCYPKYRSIGEQEVAEFIKSLSLDIIESDKNMISPYELDIYIPDKNIAIEYNGLYWHSEVNGKDKYYHLNKTLECEKKNIQLIHVFEDEWINKRKIVENKLREILNIIDVPIISINDCEIKEINDIIKDDFLNKYHIDGSDISSLNLGLYYNNELIYIMTFVCDITSNKCTISRYCENNFDYHIDDIFPNILNYFIDNYEWNEIYLPIDRRYENEIKYKDLGFVLTDITEPNCYYINGHKRINEFDYLQTSNENYDDKIWNCGYFIFKYIQGD